MSVDLALAIMRRLGPIAVALLGVGIAAGDLIPRIENEQIGLALYLGLGAVIYFGADQFARTVLGSKYVPQSPPDPAAKERWITVAMIAMIAFAYLSIG